MRLVQLSDCHLLAQASRAGYGGIQPYASFQQCVALTASLAPDAVVLTGDISGDNSAASYAHCQAILSAGLGDIPWRVIPGNHDVNAHFAPALSHAQLNAGQPWSIGRWRLHGLDTCDHASDGRHAGGFIQSIQLHRIARAIAEAPDAYHLLAMHHPPLLSYSWMDRHKLANPGYFEHWLSATPAVRAVLHGHLHHAGQQTLSHRPVWGAPSTCWQWAMTADFGVADAAPGLRIIELPDDGQLVTSIRRIA